MDDLFGTEFEDIDAARSAAMELARNLRSEQVAENGPDCILSIEICEEESDVLDVIAVRLPIDNDAR